MTRYAKPPRTSSERAELHSIREVRASELRPADVIHTARLGRYLAAGGVVGVDGTPPILLVEDVEVGERTRVHFVRVVWRDGKPCRQSAAIFDFPNRFVFTVGRYAGPLLPGGQA
jgi:hypothetical protein